MDRIQQISSGEVGEKEGVWFLTDSSLYFALDLDGGDPEQAKFVDISGALELDIYPGSRLAVGGEGTVYLATSSNVTLLDCAQDEDK